jgi:signal transduction histidine kinase
MDGQPTGDAELLDAFLRAVSHDLKSPLLTISLSNELLADVLSLDEEQAVAAREGLSEGVRELERMLDAVSAVSRARRRPLATGPVMFGDFAASIDPQVFEEIGTAVGPEPRDASLDRAGRIRLMYSLPADFAAVEGEPLRLLAGSLQDYAGTLIERLAVVQVLLERQGGSARLSGEALVVLLPSAG